MSLQLTWGQKQKFWKILGKPFRYKLIQKGCQCIRFIYFLKGIWVGFEGCVIAKSTLIKVLLNTLHKKKSF